MTQKPPPSSATLVIGVAGGSGSGKTTFSRLLQASLGDHFCGILSQDSYYRDMHEYFDKDGGQVNFDHPNSIEFELMIEHLHELKAGKDILVPNYDFKTHSRRFESTFFPCRPVILVDGILLFTQSELRALMDFAFFINTAEEIRFARRLNRDTKERGRTEDGVREQFKAQVKPMHDLFVEPSKRFADRVISGEKSFATVIDDIVLGLKDPNTGFMGLR